MRDICDCFVKAVYDSCPPEAMEEIIWLKDFNYNDLYKIDFNKLDPIAIIQNMVCQVEKAMGIYPNINDLKE